MPESASLALFPLICCTKVERIILFGSRAVGDHDERSDVDLAIAAPDLSRHELAFLRDKITHGRTLYKIMVTRLEGMPATLQDRVIKQGVVIYDRTETT
ncbi:hypothetical protein CTT39_17410 [Agrobacterium rosae]|nr:hypothetical protein CTT39_17410 [Agrobacterium rosae]